MSTGIPLKKAPPCSSQIATVCNSVVAHCRVYLLFCACLWMTGAGAMGCEPPEGPQFTNRSKELGLQLANSPACWVDLTNDGWADLCAGGVVWRNNEGKSFSKLADGVGQVVAADFDNDGFVDLFSWSGVKLFRNEDGVSFDSKPLPELPQNVSQGACCGDFDGDGDVDIYVGGYENWGKGITYPDLLLINKGDWNFALSWSDARYRARGVTACDFDRDGDLDVYVSNYRLQPNLLWQNDGSGSWKNTAAEVNVVATSKGFSGGHSIGSSWGDFNNDGWMDLFAGNFAHRDNRGNQPQSRFLENPAATSPAAFKDHGPCGIFYQESYASPSLGDFDNDRHVDLFFTTVYGTASFGRPNNSVLFHNDGKFTFSDVTKSTGLDGQPPTYQAAWADFDHDGDLDLATAGGVFQNDGASGHWLELRLEGDGHRVNRSAIGTQVQVHVPGMTLTRQVEAGTGQGNQNDLVVHFGLGDHTTPVKLTVLWPGGTVQEIVNVKIDQRATIKFDASP